MGGFFDSDDNFEVHRRNLPHRRQAGVIYFVTFHLADSLPTKKLAALEKERKIWLNLNPPPHNPRQIEEYHRNFSKRIQKWLDAGYGSRGRVWHQESFDYIVRSPAQLARFEEYIRKIPNSLPLARDRTKDESIHTG